MSTISPNSSGHLLPTPSLVGAPAAVDRALALLVVEVDVGLVVVDPARRDDQQAAGFDVLRTRRRPKRPRSAKSEKFRSPRHVDR